MNKKIIYILIIIVIILAAVIGYNYLGNVNKISIITGSGTVKVSDVAKNPVQTFPNSDVEYKATSDYILDYYAKDKSFNITIVNSDIKTARTKAEADFLTILKITPAQACALNVNLGVPFSVSQNNAGINFGLSFCPNGKPFN